MLEAVKLSMGITVDDYDHEIQDLIEAGLNDLELAGVDTSRRKHPLIIQAVKTYCRAHFHSPANYSDLKACYDEQKAQLMMGTGFTDWSVE